MDKADIDDFSHLIRKGFIERDIVLDDNRFTFRSLFDTERDKLGREIKIAEDRYRLLCRIISQALHKIDGVEVEEREQVGVILQEMPSSLISKLYEQFSREILGRLNALLSEIVKFSDTEYSEMLWSNQKLNPREMDNLVYRIWVYHNQTKEKREDQKKLWDMIRGASDSICAFINPKAWREVQRKREIRQLQSEEESQQAIEIFIYEMINLMDPDDREDIFREIEFGDVANLPFIFRNYPREKGETHEQYRKRVTDKIRVMMEENSEFDKSLLASNIANLRKEIEFRKKRIINSEMTTTENVPDHMKEVFAESIVEKVISPHNYSDILSSKSFLFTIGVDEMHKIFIDVVTGDYDFINDFIAREDYKIEEKLEKRQKEEVTPIDSNEIRIGVDFETLQKVVSGNVSTPEKIDTPKKDFSKIEDKKLGNKDFVNSIKFEKKEGKSEAGKVSEVFDKRESIISEIEKLKQEYGVTREMEDAVFFESLDDFDKNQQKMGDEDE